MRRRFITTFAVLAILFQGLSAAWAAPARFVAEQEHGASAAMEMPCHQQAKESSAHSKCCCGDEVCSKVCAASGSSAPPTQVPQLDDYIAAHFEAVRSAPAAFPAHALNRLRPPITPAS